MPDSSTIDITDLVEKSRSTFVDWALNYVFTVAIATPGLQWLDLPIINTVAKFVLKNVFNAVSNAALMQAFFLNTILRKAGQAQDFIDAVNAKNNLPPTATEDEYEKAERAQLDAFNRFVIVTN